MPNYTLTYNSDSSSLNDNTGGGWPSFYSFFPDFMIGMNSFFYSFKQGNLYRHNTSAQRNTYYGIFEASTIIGVEEFLEISQMKSFWIFNLDASLE